MPWIPPAKLKDVDLKKETPIQIRPASTVVLVREHEREPQVYLLKRSTGSGFFPGSYVFPGGALTLDERDWEFWQQHIDLPPDALLKAFGSGLAVAGIIAYGVAAIRETFEEAGVLVARKKNNWNDSFKSTRRRPPLRELDGGWFRQRVLEEDWLLSFSNLFPWSHWITPEAMVKRFDTRFFVALMPEGQECIPDDVETVHGLWVSPGKGLQANMLGEIPLSPPTLVTLHELLKFETLASLTKRIRSGSWGNPRLPIYRKLGKEAVIIQPWDLHYGKQIDLDPDELQAKVIPAGEPFSRLWLNQGIWRPVRI